MQPYRDRTALVLDLFDSYYERVYAFLRKSASSDVAEDLAQETFLRLMQHPDLERLTISVSYLLKIAHNLLRRRYARANRLRELLAERQGFVPAESRDGTGREVDGDLLETALGLIGKDERDAIRLIVCEGRSYQHAAESLGVSIATVNNWKHRGLVKLRRILADEVPAAAAGIGAADAPGTLAESALNRAREDDRRARTPREVRGNVAWRMRADEAA